MRFLYVLIALPVLCACGLKDDLYLPAPDKPQAVRPETPGGESSPVPDAPPAEEDETRGGKPSAPR